MNEKTQEVQAAQTEQPLFNELYDLEPYKKTLKNARIWLYVIAGLHFVIGIYEFNTIEPADLAAWAFGIDAFLAVIFLTLALWSRKQPVPAFTIALCFYLLITIAVMVLDPSSITSGIIIKILVTVALVKANRDARKYEEMKALIE